MTFSEVEIAVYVFVLRHPGCHASQVVSALGFTPDRITNALAALSQDGVLAEGERYYHAQRGRQPLDVHEAELASERRRKSLPTRKSPTRYHRASDFFMSRAEWRTLVFNYELMFPGEGWRVIEEHLARCARTGRKPVVTLADYDGLRP